MRVMPDGVAAGIGVEGPIGGQHTVGERRAAPDSDRQIGGRDGRFCVLAGGLGTRCLALFRAEGGLAPGFHHVALPAWSVTDPDGFRVQLYADRPGDAGVDREGEDVEMLLHLV